MPKQKKILKKPKIQTKIEKYYDFHDCIDFLENKYSVKFRDWANSHSHFNKWCDNKGFGEKDPEGKHRGSSQIWYAQYKADPKGQVTRPPYQDFWHFFISIHEIHNGCVIEVNSIEDMKHCKEQWQKDAYQLIHDEFSDKNGNITFSISW